MAPTTLAAAAAFASLLAAASALDNGLALLPQMGYNSWCECHCRTPLPPRSPDMAFSLGWQTT